MSVIAIGAVAALAVLGSFFVLSEAVRKEDEELAYWARWGICQKQVRKTS